MSKLKNYRNILLTPSYLNTNRVSIYYVYYLMVIYALMFGYKSNVLNGKVKPNTTYITTFTCYKAFVVIAENSNWSKIECQNYVA